MWNVSQVWSGGAPIYALLVITGLHHRTNAIDLQFIAGDRGTMLWSMIALSNIAQGATGSRCLCRACRVVIKECVQ